MSDSAIARFLEQFDNYVAARAMLKKVADGSDDERLCINNCADLWRLLEEARSAVLERKA